MKSKIVSLIHTLTALALLCSLASLPSLHPAAAPLAPQAEKETLLMLSIPEIDHLNIPPGMTQREAKHMSLDLIESQAQPVLAELRRLKEEGLVTDYEVRAEQNAVAVWSSVLLSEIKSIQHVVEALATQAAGTCGQTSQLALEEQIYHRSQAMALPRQPQELQATNPSIHVYAPNGADYTYFYGVTASSVQVVMRILRGGVEIFNDSTTSQNDGDYYFYPDWGSSCESQGYNWLLQAGDVVEVTAAGSTVSTEVALLEGWIDPSTDVVGGVTYPGRTVETWMHWSEVPCYTESYSMTVSPDTYGYFYADYGTGLPLDFDGRAYGFIDSMDSNGNSTYIYPDAFHINHYYDYMDTEGTLTPNTDYTAELYHGGTRVDVINGTSDADGDFYVYFDPSPQSGDTITVAFNYQPGTLGVQTLNLSLTLSPLSGTLNQVTDQVSGTTSPGSLVMADFNLRDWGNIITTCYYDWECASGNADGSGNFTLATNLDMQRGDYVYLYAYTYQGNAVSNRFHAPVLAYNQSYGELQGYWGSGLRDLTAVLMDNSHTVKDTSMTESNSSGSFYAYFGELALPGDIIELGDGTITETMTVFEFTGTLNNSTELLSGNSGGNRVRAEYYDFSREEGYYDFGCFDVQVTGGAYSIDLSDFGVEAQDDADIYSVGTDGHYMTNYIDAFSANVWMRYNEVSGNTLYTDTLVTINLWNGATLLETHDTQSYYGSYYETLTTTLTTGLRVEVLADGLTASVTIPDITVNADPFTNSLYGKAPANEPIELELVNFHNCYQSYDGWCESWYEVQTHADSSGSYNQSFDGLYSWDYPSDNCYQADVGAWCAEMALYYYQPDEHMVVYDAPGSTEAADAYETDDTPAEATVADGLSAHTFHVETDVDWFTIPISASQVGKPVYIRTVLLGPNADTMLYLYDTDGSSLLAADDDSGYGRASFLKWIPTAAGTYYVEVTPYYMYYTVRCGTGYSFLVTDVMTVLPIVVR